MKRQTAADEIHNLDPMRSLYLVWNTLLFIAEIFLRYDPPGPYPHLRAPQPPLRRGLGERGLAKRGSLSSTILPSLASSADIPSDG
jgi:hypothetical protein